MISTVTIFQREVPLEVSVQFSLAYHDWCRLQKDPCWERVEELIEKYQTEEDQIDGKP